MEKVPGTARRSASTGKGTISAIRRPINGVMFTTPPRAQGTTPAKVGQSACKGPVGHSRRSVDRAFHAGAQREGRDASQDEGPSACVSLASRLAEGLTRMTYETGAYADDLGDCGRHGNRERVRATKRRTAA
ncbi:hypothetical protein B0H17DRAFT_1121610 [Mycena rosella]|uniref:Uncharacterized protein n=1 Tax=Mycena rosella TaxID=1033263 RepID=A0AAD7AXV6_MYCRO|nr:hypothetical protein B0H17DRAFT_1121610 [Mycena rosella]